MKKRIREYIVSILSYLSRKTLAKYSPYIISITGNIGKTTTKDYIFNLLKYKYYTINNLARASHKSENSEFGVNLTILGEKNAWNNPFGWMKIILRNYLSLIFRKINYPKILILEVGADKPGDIKFITSIIKPDLVVLTAFQASPTHGEFFQNIEQHINEKKVLVKKMKKDGIVIYNSDDPIMSKIAIDKKEENNEIKIFSFGTNSDSNVLIYEHTNLYSEDSEIMGIKVKFLINFPFAKEEFEIRITDIIGEAHLYSLSAAICVAYLNDFKKEDILEAVQNIEFSKSRMRLLNGINNSKIVDDSYNSSPKASVNAIETVGRILCKGKKIAILGHMAELGEKTKEEHFNIGLLASNFFDSVILSGKYNEYYLEGLRAGKIDLSKVFLANNANEVNNILDQNNLVKENDLILIKGSQSARLEKVVVHLIENAEDKNKICRQEEEWLKR